MNRMSGEFLYAVAKASRSPRFQSAACLSNDARIATSAEDERCATSDTGTLSESSKMKLIASHREVTFPLPLRRIRSSMRIFHLASHIERSLDRLNRLIYLRLIHLFNALHRIDLANGLVGAD